MFNVEEIKNTILQGNTNELIKQLPDNSIDLVVCDPPFELQSGGGKFKDARPYLQQVSDESNFCDGIDDNFLDECKRVLKKFNGYFFCNKKQIKQYLDFADANGYFFDILMWHKTNPSPLCNHTYLPDTEYIIFIREKGVPLNTTYKTASRYWVTPVVKNKLDHPTVKPTFLMDRMIVNSSVEGDIILDPFFGTGSTGVSAKELGRNYIGFEMMPKYVEIAKERLGCPVIVGEYNGEAMVDDKLQQEIRKENQEFVGELLRAVPTQVTTNKKHICPSCTLYTDDNGICKYC